MSKDGLDCRVEQLKSKLEYCRQYETNRIKEFQQKSIAECDRWKTTIEDFELRIEKENQRSHNVELDMCAEIEVFVFIVTLAYTRSSSLRDSLSFNVLFNVIRGISQTIFKILKVFFILKHHL